MTQTKVFKKTIGTIVLVVGLLFGILYATGSVNALFTFLGSNLHFTGTVTEVGPSSFQLDKGGTYPFTIVVDGETNFNGTLSSLTDIQAGDSLRVRAREHQGTVLATSINSVQNGDYGYGGGCEAFRADELWISSIEDGVLFMSRANITFTVAYDGNTKVQPGNQSIEDLAVGDTVSVNGEDCDSSGILAKVIHKNKQVLGDAKECEADENAIVITNTRTLLSHDEPSSRTPYVAVNVPAGTYDVYGVSFDNHSEASWDALTNERWFAEGRSSGSDAFTSDSTDDLPDDKDSNKTKIGSSVSMSTDLDELRFVHAAYPDPTYQSIIPQCIIFESIDTDSEEETQPVIEENENRGRSPSQNARVNRN